MAYLNNGNIKNDNYFFEVIIIRFLFYFEQDL